MIIKPEWKRVDDVLQDGVGCVELSSWMGGDKDIVDRARICYLSEDRSTPEGDKRLLKQLITADLLHGTPLRAVQFNFKVKLPLFVMRQWTRHIVANHYDVLEFSSLGHHTFDWGGSFDEMSGRYVDFAKKAEFYDPAIARKFSEEQKDVWFQAQVNSYNNYVALRNMGLPKEVARCYIPQSIYTYMNWSVNLQGVFTWYEHRKKGSGAQAEHIAYAESILCLVELVVPGATEFFRSRF